MTVPKSSLIYFLPDGILLLDAQNRITTHNPAAEEIFGSAVLQPNSRLKAILPAVASQLESDPAAATLQGTVRLDHANGERIYQWQAVHVNAAKSGGNGRLLTLRDITDSRQTENDLRRFADRLQILRQIDKAILAAQAPEEIAQIGLEHIRQLIPCQRASLTLFNDETQTAVVVAVNQDNNLINIDQHIPLETFPLSDTLRDGRPNIFNNTRALPHPATLLRQLAAGGMLTVINIPLIVNQKLIGAINFSATKTNAFTEEQIAVASEVADPIAIAIQQARLHKQTQIQAAELRQSERSLRLLNEITQAAAGMLDLADMLQTLADRMGELVEANACHITLWDEAENRAIPAAASGPFRDDYAAIHVQPGEPTMTGAVLAAGKALIIDKTENSPYVSTRLAKLFPNTSAVLGLPLIAAERKLGAVLLLFNETHQFTAVEIERAEQAARQIALAIAKAQFYDEAKRQLEELHVLNEVAAAGAAAVNGDELIEQAIQIIGTSFYPEAFAIFLLDEKAGGLRSYHAAHQQYTSDAESLSVIPLEQGIVGLVARTGKAQRVSNTSSHPHYWASIAETQSELCVPLQVDDRVIGVINAESSQINAFSAADERLLTTLAGQLATAIKKIRLLETAQLQRQEAETLREAAAALTSTLDLNRLLDVILVQLDEVVAYDSATVFLFDGAYARVVASRGLPNNENAFGALVLAKNSLENFIRESKRPIYLEDAQNHPTFQSWGDTFYIRGWIGVPLIVRDTVIGQLTIDSRQVGSYGPAEAELALAFANQAAVAIENARLYAAEQHDRQTAEILRAANESITQKLELTAVFETLLDFLEQLVPYDSANVMLLKKGRQIVMEASRGYENWIAMGDPNAITFDLEAAQTFQMIFHSQKGMLLTDVNNYPIWIRRPETAHIQSWIGAPLMAGNAVLGFFSVDKAEAGFFTEEHLRLTEMLAAQTAVAIQNVQLFQEATRRAAELESIIYASAVLRIAQTVEEILPAVLKIAIGIVDGVEGNVFLIEPESGALVSRGCYPPNDSFNGRRHALGEGITGHVAATGQLYIAEDLANDPLVYILPEEIERVQGLGSNIGLPLHAQDRVVGVLHISLGVKRPFTPNEIRLLTAIAEIAGSALDRALLLETLEQRIAARTYDLAEANEQLQELDRLKTKFVSDVSHELRTPITNLNLYLDLIERGSPDKRDKYLTVLREQTARLKNLIEDTMSLARLDMGKGAIKFAPVNLNNIVEQVADAHLPRIEMAGLTLTLALQFDLPLLLGERNQLAQVATNLLANAINYTPQGQIALKTYLLPGEEFICLEIKDSGIGIDMEDQIHLFDRFYRGRKTGQSNIPGTGLGLAIVKEIIDLHKGVITVDSQPGQGTAVSVHLPITQTAK